MFSKTLSQVRVILNDGDKELLGPLMNVTKNGSPPDELEKFQKCLSQVPFANYTEFKDSQIQVRRMRPLVFSSIDFRFGINGHLSFHSGESETPTIGTVEDWYLINTINFGHPIHVHLIQY